MVLSILLGGKGAPQATSPPLVLSSFFDEIANNVDGETVFAVSSATKTTFGGPLSNVLPKQTAIKAAPASVESIKEFAEYLSNSTSANYTIVAGESINGTFEVCFEHIWAVHLISLF